jgi:hypothetical protein
MRGLPLGPLPDGLEVLSIREAELTAESVAAIVSSPVARGLRVLDLSGNAIGDEGARVLAAAAAELPRLESLVLSHCAIRAEGALALARSPLLGRLRSLALGRSLWSRLPSRPSTLETTSGSVRHEIFDEHLMLDWYLPRETPANVVGDEAVAAIAAGGTRLEELDLAGTPIGEAGVRALAAGLPALRSLYVFETGLDPEGAELLLGRGDGAFVHVGDNPKLPASGMALVARQAARAWVNEIVVKPTTDVDAVLEALALIPGLDTLDLTAAGVAFARVLDGAPPGLAELTVSASDDAIAAVASCPRLGNLRQLNLQWAETPALALAETLVASPHLPRSLELWISEVEVDEADLARLRERFARVER